MTQESRSVTDQPSRTSEIEVKASTSSRNNTEPELPNEPEGSPEIEQLLPDTNIVTHCIFKNDPRRLAKCFEDDQDPYKEEAQELLNERMADGKSPLDLAACLGRKQLTQELLQRGADVNSTTPKGYSCLHYAASWGHIAVMKMLIEHGADLQQRNSHGERPREAAMRYSQDECVDYLDWAEAKFLLQETIKQTLETMADVDKALAGRITKEEKTITLNCCKEKQEWLDTTEDATTQDFIAQRMTLNDVVTPVLQKLTEPRESF